MSASVSAQKYALSRCEHLGRGEPVERAVLQDVAELAHRRRGADPVADDVADHEHHASVAQRHRVVPVAADLEPDAPGHVAGREIRVLEHRQLVGQQAALQRLRGRQLALEAHRVLDRGRDPAGDLAREAEVLDARTGDRSRE